MKLLEGARSSVLVREPRRMIVTAAFKSRAARFAIPVQSPKGFQCSSQTINLN